MGRKRVGTEALRHLATVIGERFTVCRSAPENDKGRKAPVGIGWPRKPVDLGDACRAFQQDRNVGYLTGGQIAVLDFDAAVDVYELKWPHLFDGLVSRRTNAPDRAKVFVRVIDGPLPKSRSVSGKGELLTIGATPEDGRNAVVAGSYAGGTYELHGDRPVELTAAELGRIVDEWLGRQIEQKTKQTTGKHSTSTWGNVAESITAALLARPGSRRSGTEVIFRCVAGTHADKHPSASWNADKFGGVWKCQGCSAKGGWRKLAALLGINLPPVPPSDRVRRKAMAASEAISRTHWRGGSGQTDAACLGAICDAVLFTGWSTVRPGVRRISVATGISRKTVGTSIHRLETDGHLIVKKRSSAKHSDQLSLGQNYAMKRTVLTQDSERAEHSNGVVSSLDLFRRGGGGLGPAAGRLFAYLRSHGPTSKSDLATFHRVKKTVRTWLGKLESHGLITDDGHTVAAVELSDVQLRNRSQGLKCHNRGACTAGRYAREQAEHRARIDAEAWRMGIDDPTTEVMDVDTGEVRPAGSMPETPVWPYLALLVDDDVDENIEIDLDDVGWEWPAEFQYAA